MRSLFTILVLLYCCHPLAAQTRRPAAPGFSQQWKADSLGKNGFRETHYRYNKKQYQYYVNGLNFLNYRKENLLAILGRPSYTSICKPDGHLLLSYVVKSKPNTAERYLCFYLDDHLRVADIIEKVY